jgi:natural product precursor
MKTKKISSKLTLNKQTVSNLDVSQMSDLKGGTHTYFTIGLCEPMTYSCAESQCDMCRTLIFTACELCLDTNAEQCPPDTDGVQCY